MAVIDDAGGEGQVASGVFLETERAAQRAAEVQAAGDGVVVGEGVGSGVGLGAAEVANAGGGRAGGVEIEAGRREHGARGLRDRTRGREVDAAAGDADVAERDVARLGVLARVETGRGPGAAQGQAVAIHVDMAPGQQPEVAGVGIAEADVAVEEDVVIGLKDDIDVAEARQGRLTDPGVG